MLFAMVHGDGFSIQTWQKFLSSRGENVSEDVHYDEVKVCLTQPLTNKIEQNPTEKD